MIVCIRKTDLAVFVPSCEPGYGQAESLKDMLSGNNNFYFKRIVALPRRWWQRKRRWKYTGEVWRPDSGEFYIKEWDMSIHQAKEMACKILTLIRVPNGI